MGIDYYKGYKKALIDMKAKLKEEIGLWHIAKDFARVLECERLMKEIDIQLYSFPLNEVQL